MLTRVAQVCSYFFGFITLFLIRNSFIVCFYMWVVQVDFDFFGSCAAGGIPLKLPWDGPVLPGPCILQCGPCNPASHRGAEPIVNHNSGLGEGDRPSPGAE